MHELSEQLPPCTDKYEQTFQVQVTFDSSVALIVKENLSEKKLFQIINMNEYIRL